MLCMKIVSLKNTKKTQPNIFKATCETGEVFELHADAMLEYGIVLNSEIDAQVFINAVEKSEWLIACANAMNFVSRQLKTAKQLRTYLYKKGYSADTVNRLVDKMSSYNLISDETYAKMYTNSMQKSKSKSYIKNTLKQRGESEEEKQRKAFFKENIEQFYKDFGVEYKNSVKKEEKENDSTHINSISMEVSFNIDTDDIVKVLKNHGFTGEVTITIKKNIGN